MSFMLLFLLLFAILIVLLGWFILLSALWGYALTRVPFLPTAVKDLPVMINAVGLSSSDTIYDLGSGNGAVVFALEKLTGARTVGVERTLWTHLWARLRKWWHGSQATLVKGNFFDANLADATVVYCYLFPPVMARVGEKVRTDCKNGTKVVSRDFFIPNLIEQQVVRVGGHKYFIYFL
jgi:hypothetical protein